MPDVEQISYMVPFPRKFDALARVLDSRQPERAIVFCATKRMVDEVQERLQARGYSSEALHGDISQGSREKVLRSFRDGRTEVLVATDVAARGLDIPDVAIVINFDIPPDPEYYVHRIGRTGRAGTQRSGRHLREPARAARAGIDREGHRRPHPARRAANRRRSRRPRDRALPGAPPAVIQSGDWRPFREVVESLMVDYDPIEVAAAAAAIGMARIGPLEELQASRGPRRLRHQTRWQQRAPSFGSRPQRPHRVASTGDPSIALEGAGGKRFEGRSEKPAFAGKKVPYGGGSASLGKPRPPAKDRKPREW